MILENQDVPEALIVFQVEHAVPECPQDVLDLLFRHRRESAPVVRRFNNNFVSANPVHPVKQTFAFPVEITNGQIPTPLITTLSRKKSVGRLARSVEMITHRPVMGSFLNSGNDSS